MHENFLIHFPKFFFKKNIEQNNGQSSLLFSSQMIYCSLPPACNTLVIDVIHRKEDLQCHEHRCGMKDIKQFLCSWFHGNIFKTNMYFQVHTFFQQYSKSEKSLFKDLPRFPHTFICFRYFVPRTMIWIINYLKKCDDREFIANDSIFYVS